MSSSENSFVQPAPPVNSAWTFIKGLYKTPEIKKRGYMIFRLKGYLRLYNPLIGFKTMYCDNLKSNVGGFPTGIDSCFGFLVKNCVYSRLETSGIPQFGGTITKMSFEKSVCF